MVSKNPSKIDIIAMTLSFNFNHISSLTKRYAIRHMYVYRYVYMCQIMHIGIIEASCIALFNYITNYFVASK